jgi:ADP-ribosylglycohydrolase/catechol 2,3-dioxygenase-like lactoylglutathione lyase family enzyme
MGTMSFAKDLPRDHDSQDRAEGVFLGAAVGDALGWPVEDRGGRVGGKRGLEPSFDFISWRRREGGRFQPHEEQIEPGSYSDDTQLTLAVARSRFAGDSWWLHLTQRELPFWLLYERGGGGATKRSAASWAQSTPPWVGKNAKRYFNAGGNGVAMRIAAHCLAPSTTFSEVAEAVIEDGISTHGHPRALVGALLQAWAIRRSLVQRNVLGYGELLDDTLESDDWKTFREPGVAPEWEELASRHFDQPYRDVWRDVVAEAEHLIRQTRAGIDRGSLAVDEPVLKEIGSFGPSSGAGIVTAAGALFLASRYAAQPASGVVAAAFAKGADTDTLAAMTGAILGAIHGADWLSSASRRLQDAKYIRALARRSLARSSPNGGGHQTEAKPLTSRSFWRTFGEPEAGNSVELPLGRAGTVETVAQHDTKRPDLRPLTWVVSTDEGQTLYFKRVKKLSKAPEGASSATGERPSLSETDRRPRIGVVLHISDIERARSFYRDVVGLEITKASSERTVFAGLLALEPLPTPHESGKDEQLALENSFETTCAVTIYVHKLDFDDIRARVADAHRPLADVVTEDGRPTFRCLDPDGNVIEFRARNGM